MGTSISSRQEIEEALRKTAQDGRLSRGERRALSEVAATLSPAELALYRNFVFQIAHEALDGHPHARDILGWLEEVLKVLAADAAPPPSSGAYFAPGEEPLLKISSVLGAAQKSADICVFTITDDRIAEVVLACHKRGVKVRVITDDEKAFDVGSDIHRLQAAGIATRTDHSEHHMHHKFAVVDRATLITGSYNWTRAAAEHNHENIIVTDDPRLIGPFADMFEHLWHELLR